LALNNDRRLRIVHRPGNICSHCHPGKRLRDSLFGRIDFSEAAFLHQLTIFSRGAFGPVPQHVPIPPVEIFLLAMVQGVITGFTLNLPFTFGEELGWRGLLLRETQTSGFLRSNLFRLTLARSRLTNGANQQRSASRLAN
jgi:hypothetical protein